MDAVRRAAERGAAEWFPTLAGSRVTARLHASARRPRCELHEVVLEAGARQERVVVKVRRDGPSATVPGSSSGRPLLAAITPATPAEMAQSEFEGLLQIVRATTPADRRFLAVRPLALLVDHAAFVMDHVTAPTMRSVLLTASRFDPRRSSHRTRLEHAFAGTGALLRAYHAQPPHRSLPPRQQTRSELIGAFYRYVDHLASVTGQVPFFDGLGPAGGELLRNALPELLPLAVGHGDFVVRNLFIAGNDGRVQLIDPMPRWQVPVYEDLARFVIGFRLLGLQVATAGAAFEPRLLDRLEGRFLSGYFGDDPVPTEAVRAYQLVVLLDKWSAAAGRRPGHRLTGAVDSPGRWMRHAYFRSQAQRLVAPADSRGARRA